MMDRTKSREEFEEWLKSKMPTTYRLAFECSDDDELTNSAKASVLAMRTAWQASRESIVVELPMRLSPCRSGYGYTLIPNDIGEALEYEALVLSLRTAGIRIKGESE